MQPGSVVPSINNSTVDQEQMQQGGAEYHSLKDRSTQTSGIHIARKTHKDTCIV